jgi:hypothetical protein
VTPDQEPDEEPQIRRPWTIVGLGVGILGALVLWLLGVI